MIKFEVNFLPDKNAFAIEAGFEDEKRHISFVGKTDDAGAMAMQLEQALNNLFSKG